MTPCCLSRNSRSHTTCRACGSSPVVGSSSSSSSGSLISDRAIVSRRFMPPDSGSTFEVARSDELDEVEQRVGPLAHDRARAARSSRRRSAGCRGRSARCRGCPPGARRRAGRGSPGRRPPGRGRRPAARRRTAARRSRSSASSRSCRRRWARGSRTPRPRCTSKSMPSTAVEVAEALDEAARGHEEFGGHGIRP